MSAHFDLFGRDLDIEALLAALDPPPRLIFRQGTPVRRKQPEGPRHVSSKLLYKISEATWDDPAGQFRDALAFMQGSRDLIRRSVAFPGVTAACFTFPVEQQEGPVIRISLPAEFIAAAASLGVSAKLSYYGYWEEERIDPAPLHCHLRLDGAPAPEPLSSADEGRFDDQIDDATEYLVKWCDALRSRSVSDRMVMEFPIRFRRVLCNEAFLPVTFLQAAGAAGIAVELAFHPLLAATTPA